MLSPIALTSPPPRGGGAQTRSSGPAASPCVVCSPPAREKGVRSPLGGHVKATDDPVGLMVETWCSPTLVSPAGRQCSVWQLAHHQGAGPVNISDAFLEEKQWDMEAMVLSTIAGQLEPRCLWRWILSRRYCEQLQFANLVTKANLTTV